MTYIVLRFASNDTIASSIVRYFTWSAFSHIDYIFDDGRCYSALPSTGVGFNSDINDYVEHFELKVKNKNKIEDFLLAQEGKKYDWSAIFGIPFRTKWNNDSKWFCSELITAAVEQDIKLFNEPDKYRITPRDLYINPLLNKIT
jgi:hypothetical protein